VPATVEIGAFSVAIWCQNDEKGNPGYKKKEMKMKKR
jgi:hypothetical protein